MTSDASLRPLLEDLIRLGLEAVPGFTNRAVDQLQLEHITNPYGRQPPHVLIFPDGRVERMTPFQTTVPGYAPNVVAVELLGYPGQPPSAEQAQAVRALGAQVRQMLAGKISFTGNAALVREATGEQGARPSFMGAEELAVAPAPVSRPVQAANVQDIFEILGTSPDRRTPLKPGCLFNTVTTAGAGPAVVEMRQLFRPVETRQIMRLVVVPSHDASKPEPENEQAYSLEELRKADQRVGMSDFRGHYLLARDGSLIPARDLGVIGNCWPGKNEQSIQIVLAGNGKKPTREQRESLYLYAAAMRKYYERPLQGSVRDITYGEALLGVDPTGMMKNDLANARMIDAELPVGKESAKRAG